jgi:hypothetical protein
MSGKYLCSKDPNQLKVIPANTGENKKRKI